MTVVKNKKKGLVDTLGNEIIAPEYEALTVLYDTLAAVRKESKWGLLNLQTNTLHHPLIFDKFELIGNQIPCFTLNPQKAYLNYQGEYVWKETFFNFNE